MTLKKSDLYYDKANVNLDGITFKVITDDNARGVAMRTGAVDMALTIPLLDVAALKKESNVRVLSEVGAGWNGVAINVANTNGAGQPQVQRRHLWRNLRSCVRRSRSQSTARRSPS